MTDERRERFAAAIQRRVVPEYTLTSILPEVYEAADAAMAVADAEMKLDESNFILVSGNADYWKREADRLRAEVDRVRSLAVAFENTGEPWIARQIHDAIEGAE